MLTIFALIILFYLIKLHFNFFDSIIALVRFSYSDWHFLFFKYIILLLESISISKIILYLWVLLENIVIDLAILKVED